MINSEFMLYIKTLQSLWKLVNYRSDRQFDELLGRTPSIFKAPYFFTYPLIWRFCLLTGSSDKMFIHLYTLSNVDHDPAAMVSYKAYKKDFKDRVTTQFIKKEQARIKKYLDRHPRDLTNSLELTKLQHFINVSGYKPLTTTLLMR